ncbi:hypothetical protein B0H67DRAFT_647979 [Lasiosphaeris hirsuta]|uniref:SnoaL-like domain-containing protein n=1 Tax=Lasiosphaeris hirsuta TaxID=260670 RepID=A0AA40DP02_9PEZI|nr:hypothetical protein B0H67DRAFT_647979 [Lasiosphaeris hirsuta]
MSVLHQTVLNVIDAYNSWDIEKIMAVRAPECIQEMLPNTLGIPAMDNAAYEAWQKNTVLPIFRNLRLEVLDVIEDTENNKVAIWAKSSAESPIGPYANQYMLVLHMTKEGDKLVRLREFADSAYSNEFFPKLRKAMAGGKPTEK